MRQALPIPQRVMAVVLSVLFVFCPFAAYAAGESDTAADPVLLPIIMYHEVKPNKSGKDAIQPWEFEADLKWLADNGYVAGTASGQVIENNAGTLKGVTAERGTSVVLGDRVLTVVA